MQKMKTNLVFRVNRAIRLGLMAAALILFPTLSVPAALSENIADDFKPIPGFVVQKAGDGWIIDLDQNSGIRPGDLFGVIGSGEKLVHPVTGQELGVLETRKGMLQVMRLMPGYAFTRVLEGADRINPGDAIRRFEKVPAQFWDYPGTGQLLAEQLVSLLPHLDWQSYEAAQAERPKKGEPPKTRRNAVYFVFDGQQLNVRGPDFLPVLTYALEGPLTDAQLALLPVKPLPLPVVSEPSPGPAPEQPPRRTDAVVTYPTLLAGSETVANLERVTLNAAFVNHENALLMASTDGSKIYIDRVAERLIALTVGDTPVPAKILALDWWQPADGPLHLAVVTWYNDDVRSNLFRLEADGLILVQDFIRRVLGTFDIDQDGRPETLLAQRLDRKTFFGRVIEELTYRNGKMVQQDPSVILPEGFTVLGASVVDLTGDGSPETIFVRTGLLYIYSGRKRLYTSPKEMGGSLNYLVYDIDPTVKDLQTTQVFIEVSPKAHDFDGDGRSELLAVASNLPALTAPGLGVRADQFRLVVLKFQDGRFTKGKFEGEIDMAVQGLTVKDDSVLLVLSEPVSFFGKKGASHLLRYSLAKH
jgi:hypothetical protein